MKTTVAEAEQVLWHAIYQVLSHTTTDRAIQRLKKAVREELKAEFAAKGGAT